MCVRFLEEREDGRVGSIRQDTYDEPASSPANDLERQGRGMLVQCLKDVGTDGHARPENLLEGGEGRNGHRVERDPIRPEPAKAPPGAT